MAMDTGLRVRMTDAELARVDRLVLAVQAYYSAAAERSGERRSAAPAAAERSGDGDRQPPAIRAMFADAADTVTRSSALRLLLLAWENGWLDQIPSREPKAASRTAATSRS